MKAKLLLLCLGLSATERAFGQAAPPAEAVPAASESVAVEGDREHANRSRGARDQASSHTQAAEQMDDADDASGDQAATTTVEEWGDWASEQLTISDASLDQRQSNNSVGVGIRGEDELLLNQLDNSVITRVSAALIKVD